MLIEFSVTNFRSFRERQTFSMTAVPRLGKKQNTFDAGVKGESLPAFLKVAAIYGGNASGKSSFIKALGFIGSLIKRGPDVTGKPLPVSPFRFDKNLLGKPSEFETHFLSSGQRYQFRVGATTERITEEVLFHYPNGKEQLIYSRQHVGGVDKFKFGKSFEGDEVLRAAWQRLTAPGTLFIAQAVANSSEELKQLRIPFAWLKGGMFVLDDDFGPLSRMGQHLPVTEKKFLAGISSFLQDVDVPVTQIDVEKQDELPAAQQNHAVEKAARANALFSRGKVTLTHRTRLSDARFDYSEESRGTQNLIGFWLPWQLMTIQRDDLDDQLRILVVDELDSSLHPEIIQFLISKYLQADSRTQLIFTTHDTHLMSTKLLRRDQFWLTDRDSNGATQLQSVYATTGRETEDVEKRYYEGRYRGLPITRGK